MPSYPRPLRALLPLAVAALLAAGAAPQAAPQAAAAATAAAPTDRLIVTLRPGDGVGLQSVDSPEQVASELSDDAGAALEYVRPLGDGAHLLALDGARPYAEVQAVARRLAAAPEVLSAEPDLVVFPTREPSDSGYAAFGWHMKGVAGGSYGANLPGAWAITTGAPGIVAAIVDTGARLGHAELAGRTPMGNPGYDMIGDVSRANDGDGRDADPSDPGDFVLPSEAAPGCPSDFSTWHGTHVAGTLGARANNGGGVAGALWDSPILHIRALGKCGGYISDIADGVRWAAGLAVGGLPPNPNPARVVNLSLGGSGSCSSYFQSAVDAAAGVGAVVVVAAGNENRNASGSTPGNCSGVITVAATAQHGGRASYSNYGSGVELAAPGGDSAVDSMVYSTLDSGRYGPEGDAYDFYQGTSMATPHVAGIAALMLSANPTLSVAEVLSILQITATPFPPGSSCAGVCGAGIANGGAAVEEAARRVRGATFDSDASTADEGATVSIPVRLSVASNQTVAVPYAVAGSAGAADHTLAAGSLTFAPGVTTASLTLRLTDDTLSESDETVVVSLGPGARSGLGAVTAHTVTIRDNDARPMIALAPAALAFGEQRVGTAGLSQTVAISNAGELPLTVSGLALSAGFGRAGGSCPPAVPFTLARGASCTVGVQFAPARTGARGGSLAVSSDAGAPALVALSGLGVTPALGTGPTSLSFDPRVVGAASPTGTVTLTNPGTAPLRISALTAGGDYRVGATTCPLAAPGALAPGASCSVEVGFTPGGPGARPGALTVSSDVPGGPYTVALRGEGLAPELTLDAAALNFGGQRAGTSAVSRTVTVANTGGAPLGLGAIAVGGAAFSRAGGSCPAALPATLAPGASCTVQVGFDPAATAAYTGALSVTSDGGDAAVALAGAGTAGPAASPALSPAALSFADRVLPAATGARAIRVSNQGEAAMTVQALSLSGAGFAITGGDCAPLPLAIAPGAGCMVEVSLTGAATGAYSGTLTVATDAPGGPQTAALAGAVVAGAGLFALEDVALEAGATTVTLRFTVARAAPADGAAAAGYSVVADREVADGDLLVAAGQVALAAGETSDEVAVTLERLALYGAGRLVISLDDPAGRARAAPAASTTVALPGEGHTLYAPLLWR